MRISNWSSDLCSSDRRHVPEPTHEPSMDDRLEAEAVDAAVALMVPVLKAFMADKPSRQIAEMQKPHAQKLAIAAISGWIAKRAEQRSEEHTSELQSLMRISYAVFCLKKKTSQHIVHQSHHIK